VHVEGCQLDAAQAVSGLDVLDQLSALAERSLVAVTHDETGPRYLRAALAGMLRDGHADPRCVWRTRSPAIGSCAVGARSRHVR
jgi:hypothetical protein